MKAIDPICGMEVDSGTDLHTEYKGKTYYFCSREDQNSFLKNPEKYVKGETEHRHSHGGCC